MTESALPDLLRAHPGRVAARALDLNGEVLFTHDEDHVFHAASTIKVPLLVRALQRVANGELDLTERHEVRAGDRVTGAGVLHELSPGLRPTLRDLLTLMIVVSDNTATNIVIDLLGVPDVNAFLDGQGLSGTRLVGGLQLPPERKTPEQRAGGRNQTTARDMAVLLLRLARGELLPPEQTEAALDILCAQQYREIVGRHAPRGPDGELLYRVASKSGELPGVRHDVGVLFTPRPLVLVVLSEGGTDPREHPDNTDVAVLARFAGALVERYGDISPTRTGLH